MGAQRGPHVDRRVVVQARERFAQPLDLALVVVAALFPVHELVEHRLVPRVQHPEGLRDQVRNQRRILNRREVDEDHLPVAPIALLRCDRGGAAVVPLKRQSVALFYRRLKEEMEKLDLEVRIHPKPNEIPNPIPFDQDEVHASYDPEYAHRFWRVLLQCDRVFKIFRARFVGKCSPVHFFWGAPDLAVTRFSGRLAPLHPGGVPNLPDRVAREAYSHEVSSCGFWPGGGPIAYPAFYSYAYPEPEGFAKAPIRPAAAFYSSDLREFILPYDEVRNAKSPDDILLDFLQTTYETEASLAKWNRATLEGLRHL